MDLSPPNSSVHGFPRQEHWSELPFPFPGDLPDPGIETTFAPKSKFFTTSHQGNPAFFSTYLQVLRVITFSYWGIRSQGKLLSKQEKNLKEK